MIHKRVLQLGQLQKELRADAQHYPQAIRKAAFEGASLLMDHLVERTPDGITGEGAMKQRWSVELVGESTIVVKNDAPYAGVIERGCGPHPVSPEGISAITAWGMGKLGLSLEDATNLAWGVAHRLEEEGQPGHWIVRDARPLFIKYIKRDVERYLPRRFAG